MSVQMILWLYVGIPHPDKVWLPVMLADNYGFLLEDIRRLSRNGLQGMGIMPIGGSLHRLEVAAKSEASQRLHVSGGDSEARLQVCGQWRRDGRVWFELAAPRCTLHLSPRNWPHPYADAIRRLGRISFTLNIRHTTADVVPSAVLRHMSNHRKMWHNAEHGKVGSVQPEAQA